MLHRYFAAMLGAAALALAAPTAASAADYPAKPVQLIVPFSAGGGNDIVARILAKNLAPAMKSPVVVENKPGAGGNIGMQYVARSKPDGYTLAYVSNTVVMNPYLYRDVGFDIQKDFEPVALLATTPIWLLVNPKLPIKSVQDLIAYAKAHPGKLSYATPGVGTPHHLAMELLKNMTGIDLVHVPYKGASGAATDAVGGQVPVLVSTPASVKGFVQSGQLRALASMDPKRGEGAGALPVVGDTVPGFSVTIWHGLMAPAGTPASVIAFWAKAMDEALKTPSFRKELADVDFAPAFEGSADMKRRIANELGVWGKVTKQAGIKPE